MLTREEIKLKIEALEAEAAKLGEPDGARFRELAVKWRLIEVEATFMDAMRMKLIDDSQP
jgi:hypothetical protein